MLTIFEYMCSIVANYYSRHFCILKNCSYNEYLYCIE